MHAVAKLPISSDNQCTWNNIFNFDATISIIIKFNVIYCGNVKIDLYVIASTYQMKLVTQSLVNH